MIRTLVLGVLTATAALIVLVVAVPHAEAGGCRTCYRAPQKVIVQEVVRPVYPVTNINHVYHFVGAAVREYVTQPQHVIAAEVGQLERQMERLQGQLEYFRGMQQAPPQQQQYGYAPPQQYGYAPPPQQQWAQQQAQQCQGSCPNPTMQPAAQPPAVQQPVDDRPQFSVQQRPVTQKHCAQCHTGPDAKGQLDFEQPLNFKQKLEVWSKTHSGAMPKNGQALSDEEMEQLIREHVTEEEWAAMRRIIEGPPASEEATQELERSAQPAQPAQPDQPQDMTEQQENLPPPGQGT